MPKTSTFLEMEKHYCQTHVKSPLMFYTMLIDSKQLVMGGKKYKDLCSTEKISCKDHQLLNLLILSIKQFFRK